MFDPELCSASFCPAMTDDEVREIVQFERIERYPASESGRVWFMSSQVERGRIQERLLRWWNDWNDRQPKKPPFDYDLDDIIEMQTEDGMKKYRAVGSKLVPIDPSLSPKQ
jgi:hypothetical protein